MAQEITTEQVEGQSQRRSRGPTKQFPNMPFEDTLSLSRSILEHGVNGEIQRLTLFSKIGVSPSSIKTRELISSSFKYGLTSGSYNAPSLNVTNDGHVLLSSSSSPRIIKEKQFELAIKQFDQFNSVYEKLKNRRLPDIAVLKDELGRVQVAESDRGKVAEIFIENLRFLGLVNDISGSAYVRTVEDVLEEVPKVDDSATERRSVELPVENAIDVAENGKAAVETKRPALHIDIQVHIDPTSSAEQIDHIFASMARHLYGLES